MSERWPYILVPPTDQCKACYDWAIQSVVNSKPVRIQAERQWWHDAGVDKTLARFVRKTAEVFGV